MAKAKTKNQTDEPQWSNALFGSFYDSEGAEYFFEMVASDLPVRCYKVLADGGWYEVKRFDNRETLERDIFLYILESKLIPQRVKEIKEDLKVLQQEPVQVKHYRVMTDAEVASKSKEYFETKADIKRLQEERDEEIKDAKKTYGNLITPLEEKMSEIEPVIVSRQISEEVPASWERDLEAGLMIQIRHDTKEVLNLRKIEQNGIEDQANAFENASETDYAGEEEFEDGSDDNFDEGTDSESD